MSGKYFKNRRRELLRIIDEQDPNKHDDYLEEYSQEAMDAEEVFYW